MLWIVAATSVLVLAASLPVLAQVMSFDADPVGAAPKGWTLTMTGGGAPKWTVERDDTAPSKGQVLKQSGTATFPLALKDGTSIKDGFVEVMFKPISGSEDRAGGLVWRAKDANNYYVVRANALEDNVVLYKTVNGVRNSLCLPISGTPSGSSLPARALKSYSTKRRCSRSRMQRLLSPAWRAFGPKLTVSRHSMPLLSAR